MQDPIKLLTVSEYKRLKPKYDLYLGPTPPSNDLGKDGDLFILYEETVNETTSEPYNVALVKAGLNTVDSLDTLLNNSDYCTTIAGDSEAVEIIKSNYSTELTNAIDNNFNDGLNLLNHKCQLKCYLYKAGNKCTNITGGWTTQIGTVSYNTSGMKCTISSSDMCIIRTTNTINCVNYNTLCAKTNITWYADSENVKVGLSTYDNLSSDKSDAWIKHVSTSSAGAGKTENNKTISVNIESANDKYYVKLTEYMWGSAALTFTDVYIMP